MGILDFLFGLKVINDQDRDIDEEDELMDLMYIREKMEKQEKEAQSQDDRKKKW